MDTFDVAVIGLGFTGVAAAVSAERAGFRVVGLDNSSDRVRLLTGADRASVPMTISERELCDLVARERLDVRCMSSFGSVARTYIMCVPTPAGKSVGADLTALLEAADAVGRRLRSGDLVVIQSTCPPGASRRVATRLAERSGLTIGSGFRLAYSPVRIDAARGHATLWNVPRVVAGATPACARAALRFLRRLTDRVIPVGTLETAELVKVFENTFRQVNISLANELAALCRESDVDVSEVLAAADTKPFGFLRHDPGPGAGGDCVPVCARFFAAAARERNAPSSTVDAAIALNEAMPAVVVQRLRHLLAAHRLPPLENAAVLIVGVTYKPDVGSVRRSAGVAVLERLRSARADVAYHDPLVPRLRLTDGTELVGRPTAAPPAALAVVMTRHRGLDLGALVRAGVPIVDCTTGEPRLVAATEEDDHAA